ncbi:hydroxylase [Acrocarpospora phusangensis]|uniref:Hydroxylase n=1 Tax=Acrocarpospora phusangensis TaxID=1070424 RepID=A0A919Q9X9_9ACTN|nr:VOC family protein [Acrocarpospora phusangensis]GIH24171.1 hydroxylase [Acrocarpospora phusangensis]
MAGRARYAAGKPCWVDLGTGDLAGAEEFYHGLFGWDFEPRGRTHSTALLRAQPVAGLGPAREAGWVTHMAVDDLNDTVEAAVRAGGRLLHGPEQVFDEGREQGWGALLADPAGAVFGVWEERDLPGAAMHHVPGTFCWHELAVRDTEAAAGFYGRVFGWQGRVSGSYTEFDLRRPRETVTGMVEMTDAWPDEIPPHWMVYFAVADCLAAADRVEELGGVVEIPPFALPSGRVTVAADPQGAVFSLIELAG